MNPQWQPIKTVPQSIKDEGTDVLLASYHGVYGVGYAVGFWVEDCGFGFWKSSLIKHPTHWMPIPPLTVN